jgi:hypothetical protein
MLQMRGDLRLHHARAHGDLLAYVAKKAKSMAIHA